MRVLIVGAGASKEAGYPLASNLMTAIGTEMTQSSVNDRTAWDAWDQYRRSISGHLGAILDCPNPEVTLSLLDLYEQALKANDDEWLEARLRQARDTGTAEPYDGHYESADREELEKGTVARNRLVDCLHSYFAFKHWSDAQDRRPREYLAALLAQLAPNDVVITFNWDTTVERSLAEAGRWSPFAGYGFEKGLLLRSPYDDPLPLPIGLPTESEVSVLKLHGSFGWHHTTEGDVYFDHRYYLCHFGFEWNGQPLQLIDPRARSLGPPVDFAFAYPTFLKQLRGKDMQTIWHRAAMALAEASTVEVWGYSLPASDLGARVLLNGLRSRLDARTVEVNVHVADDVEAERRWREFLGNSAGIDRKKLQ